MAHSVSYHVASDTFERVKPAGGGLPFANGVTDEAIAKGAAGTVSLYDVSEDGTETDTTRNVEARNRYADVATGKKVGLIKKGGVWFLIAAEC